MIDVVHVQRKPITGLHFSVERYFAMMRGVMADDIRVRLHVLRFESRGALRRLGVIADTARQRGDVVHITGDVHFAGLALRRRRAVITVLDCGIAVDATGLRRAIFTRLWLRWPSRRAARIVAISSFTADQIAAYAAVPRDRITVVPIAIDDTFGFQPAATTRAGRPPVVLCFGRTPNKNLDRSIDALRGLDVQLNVIGALASATEAKLRQSRIAYTNDVAITDAEMRDRYRNCDLVLFPSTYEGFGIPIVEAQATGRPVVTSDRAPMNEVAGGAACLVDPDDVASIRAGVVKVLEDTAYREELVEAGLRNRERFRPEAAARAYAQIYREVVAGS